MFCKCGALMSVDRETKKLECRKCALDKKRASAPTLEEKINKALEGNDKTKAIVADLKASGIEDIARWYIDSQKGYNAVHGKLMFEDGTQVYNTVTHVNALDLSENVPERGYRVKPDVKFISIMHTRGEQKYYFMVGKVDSNKIAAAKSILEMKKHSTLVSSPTSLANYVLFPIEFDD